MNKDIIDCIDEYVQKVAKLQYANDKQCPPKFFVSLDNEDLENQRILLTIKHLDNTFTSTLFPCKDTRYGYESIEDEMGELHARTM